jgi:hypothetical protein
MWALLAEKMNMADEPDFIDVSETQDVREIELPRWVQVPVGIVFSLFTLLCGFASAYLLFVPNKRAPILAFVVGFILLVGCGWVLEKCFRLITGRKTRDGLMSHVPCGSYLSSCSSFRSWDCSLASIARWVPWRFIKQ